MSTLGDVIDRLDAQDVRRLASAGPAPQGPGLSALGAPSNNDIIVATKEFYHAKHKLVDTSANNARTVADTQKSFVAGINNYKDQFNNKQVPTQALSNIKRSLSEDPDDGGMFGPVLDELSADDMFTTICVGVSAEVAFFVGGMGGLGCAFDIAKREDPRGYGYATGEAGLKLIAAINVQLCFFNELPSALDLNIFGVSISMGAGLVLGFAPFFKIIDGKVRILGYSVSAGLGAAGGAAVFGGHVWNFA